MNPSASVAPKVPRRWSEQPCFCPVDRSGMCLTCHRWARLINQVVARRESVARRVA